MSKVLLESIGKTFDGKKMVLNDFSLKIDDGDFVVLIRLTSLVHYQISSCFRYPSICNSTSQNWLH